MIDAGHGGIDPGAAGSGNVVEKDLVLSFALRLKKKLEESGRFRASTLRRSWSRNTTQSSCCSGSSRRPATNRK